MPAVTAEVIQRRLDNDQATLVRFEYRPLTTGTRVLYAGGHYGFKTGDCYPVLKREAAAAVRAHPDRNVLAVWPTLNDGWAHRAAAEMRPGRLLFLVSEGQGGCCADDALFELLDAGFEAVTEQRLPVWYGLHDRLSVHRRAFDPAKSQRNKLDWTPEHDPDTDPDS